MANSHVVTKYIERQGDFENFLKFRYTLMVTPPGPFAMQDLVAAVAKVYLDN